MVARSLWHIDQNHSEIRSVEIDGQDLSLLLTSLYSLVSLGTERLVCRNEVPVELSSQMRVPHMEGDFSLPVKYGYSLVGKDAQGMVYHVMHPHQDICLVDKKELTIVPVHIPPRRAVLISNLETALNAYWDAEPTIEEHILIVGFGLIGALIACLLKMKGYKHLAILEQDPYRYAYGQRLGFKMISPDVPISVFHLAFNTSGSGHGLQYGIDHMDHEGRIIELSWYGSKRISLNLGSAFHYKRLSIQSSQVSSIPKKLMGQQTVESRKREVIRLLEDPDWDLLLDKTIPFDESARYFDQIRVVHLNALSLILNY